jgi:hypothetical protein
VSPIPLAATAWADDKPLPGSEAIETQAGQADQGAAECRTSVLDVPLFDAVGSVTRWTWAKVIDWVRGAGAWTNDAYASASAAPQGFLAALRDRGMLGYLILAAAMLIGYYVVRPMLQWLSAALVILALVLVASRMQPRAAAAGPTAAPSAAPASAAPAAASAAPTSAAPASR